MNPVNRHLASLLADRRSVPDGLQAVLKYRAARTLEDLQAQGSRALGHAGPSNAKATEAYTKYIITDMYAKAVQGMPAEAAVRWAEGELKKIYETQGSASVMRVPPAVSLWRRPPGM